MADANIPHSGVGSSQGSGLKRSLPACVGSALGQSGRELSVDLERIRTDIYSEALTQQPFSPREVDALRALAACQKYEALGDDNRSERKRR